ncbi:MAG: sel1 repeat family protein, partial [Gammaproteobacteria bacterium]|nr:sel1 repeat family protein [Gammaproteobacteria bacterium]
MLVIVVIMLRFLSGLLLCLFSVSLQASCLQENLSEQQNFAVCQQLANDGDVLAINAVASMYEKGEGVHIDAMQAFRYFERSANLGNVSGQYNL